MGKHPADRQTRREGDKLPKINDAGAAGLQMCARRATGPRGPSLVMDGGRSHLPPPPPASVCFLPPPGSPSGVEKIAEQLTVTAL